MPLTPVDTTTDHGTYKGDPARVAFGKLNDNDVYLEQLASSASSAANAAMPKSGGTFTGTVNGTDFVVNTIRANSGGNQVFIRAGGGTASVDAVNAQNSAFAPLTFNATSYRFGGGAILPGTDGVLTNGTASNRWSTVYATTGTINTSDAREKTGVSPMTAEEMSASRMLAAEIGTFRFLAAVAEKGDVARLHVGMTVQRAIEVMKQHGLDPFAYSFICHDTWQGEAEVAEQWDDEFDGAGQLIRPAGSRIVVPARDAGDRYSFRIDGLLLFLARGFDARLQALEAAA